MLQNIRTALSIVSKQSDTTLWIKIPEEDIAFAVDKEFEDLFSEKSGTIIQPIIPIVGGKPKNFKPCDQIFYTILIRYSGMVSACCVDVKDELNIGDLKTESLTEIINGDKLRSLRRLHLTGKLRSIPICNRCCFRTDIDLDQYKDELLTLLERKA